jgi:hypothetical protein
MAARLPPEDLVMKKAAVIGSALLSLVFAAAVSAQTPQSDSAKASEAHQQFSSIDTNGDGRVSQAEAKAKADLNAAFPALDTDRDTYISELEYGKWSQQSRARCRPPTTPPLRPTARHQKAPFPRRKLESSMSTGNSARRRAEFPTF